MLRKGRRKALHAPTSGAEAAARVAHKHSAPAAFARRLESGRAIQEGPGANETCARRVPPLPAHLAPPAVPLVHLHVRHRPCGGVHARGASPFARSLPTSRWQRSGAKRRQRLLQLIHQNPERLPASSAGSASLVSVHAGPGLRDPQPDGDDGGQTRSSGVPHRGQAQLATLSAPASRFRASLPAGRDWVEEVSMFASTISQTSRFWGPGARQVPRHGPEPRGAEPGRIPDPSASRSFPSIP